jgi:hypothetical protein
MSSPVAAYRRVNAIAVRFSDGNVNEFDSSLGHNATWSLVCFDGRESGWEPMDLEEAEKIADECGLVWGDE